MTDPQSNSTRQQHLLGDTHDLSLTKSSLSEQQQDTLREALDEIADTRPHAHMNLHGTPREEHDGQTVPFLMALLGDETPARALQVLGFTETQGWEALKDLPLETLKWQVIDRFDELHGGPPTDLDMQHLEWKRCVESIRERHPWVLLQLNGLHPIVYHTAKQELLVCKCHQNDDLHMDPRYFPVWDTDRNEMNLVETYAAVHGIPSPQAYLKWEREILPAFEQLQQELLEHLDNKRTILDTVRVLRNSTP